MTSYTTNLIIFSAHTKLNTSISTQNFDKLLWTFKSTNVFSAKVLWYTVSIARLQSNLDYHGIELKWFHLCPEIETKHTNNKNYLKITIFIIQ